MKNTPTMRRYRTRLRRLSTWVKYPVREEAGDVDLGAHFSESWGEDDVVETVDGSEKCIVCRETPSWGGYTRSTRYEMSDASVRGS